MAFVIIDHPTIMRIVQTCIFRSLEPCSCNFWFFLNSTISFYVGSKLCVNQTKSSMILLTRKQSAIVCPIHGGIFLENLLPLRPRLWMLVQVCKVVGSSPKGSLLLNLKNVRKVREPTKVGNSPDKLLFNRSTCTTRLGTPFHNAGISH